MQKKKMDRYLMSNQPWEFTWAVKKMAKEGIIVTVEMVKQVKKEVGRSRRKIYKNIRENAC